MPACIISLHWQAGTARQTSPPSTPLPTHHFKRLHPRHRLQRPGQRPRPLRSKLITGLRERRVSGPAPPLKSPLSPVPPAPHLHDRATLPHLVHPPMLSSRQRQPRPPHPRRASPIPRSPPSPSIRAAPSVPARPIRMASALHQPGASSRGSMPAVSCDKGTNADICSAGEDMHWAGSEWAVKCSSEWRVAGNSESAARGVAGAWHKNELGRKDGGTACA